MNDKWGKKEKEKREKERGNKSVRWTKLWGKERERERESRWKWKEVPKEGEEFMFKKK